MNTAEGSLTFVGLNTVAPQIFWNGAVVPNVVSIRTDWESDDARVKLVVSAITQELNDALTNAGVIIKIRN